MLIATPVLIDALGLEQFGVLILTNSLVGFSSVFNFGFGDTALKYVSQSVARSERERAAETVRTVAFLAVASGIAVAAVFASIAPIASRLLNIGHLSYTLPALYVTAIIMPMRMSESVYISSLRGCYRYDLPAYVTVCTKFANIATQVILALLGHQVHILLMATAITVLISNISLFVLCWSQIGPVFPKYSQRAFAEFRNFSVWSWLQGLAGILYANADRFLVSAILGPTALGLYGVCVQLAQNLHNGIVAVSHGVFPRVSMIQSSLTKRQDQGNEELRSVYRRASALLTATVVTAGSLLAIFAYPVLDLWVGSEIAEEGFLLLALLSISYSWYSSNHTLPFFTLNGLGLARLQAQISIICAILFVSATIIMLPFWGLVGVAVARFIDIPVRIGLRIYIGRKIIRRIPVMANIDFLRVSVLVLAVSYVVKRAFGWYFGSQGFLSEPVAVVLLIVYSIAAFFLATKLETRIAGGAVPYGP
jgi:O-antigen/teichoic acid export membrane protein